MKRTRFLFLVIFCFLALILANGMSEVFPAACTVVTIKIAGKTEIEKNKVLLGDIAEIRGEEQELVQKLQTVFLCRSPLPGKSRVLDKGYIRLRLKQHGIDLSQIDLRTPGEIIISGGFYEFPEEKIREAVLDFLYRKMPWEKSRVKIGNIHLSNMVILPKGDISYEVIPPSNTKFLGTIPLSILFKVNGGFQKKIWATVKIGVLTDVVVSRRPLRRSQVITEEDIHLQKRDLAKLPSNVITSCQDIIGKRTKRKIASSVVLRADHVELPPLVKRGDVVLIIAESDGLRIRTLGKVRERGRCGDRVKVVNLDSNKGIYARVIDSNTVKVDF